VALDRQDIERRYFPIARRGYDPDAVDAHLRRIADQLAQIERSPRGAETLATGASEQVRAIVEAAENTSADITREAEDDARSIRDEAASDAERSRADAASQAREHVANVSEATKVMLQRVDAMESELGALVESLRTGANRLTADLTLLQGNMGELRAAAGQADAPPAAAKPEPVVAEPEPEPEPEPELELEEEPEAEAEPEPAPEPAPTQAGADSEGARLIALNMALNGTPQEETDRYLAENFDLEDRGALLDEVYSRVG
jgi:DivIVA domain-containing protein